MATSREIRSDRKHSRTQKRDSRRERVGVLVRMPRELKVAVVEEVRSTGANANDVIVAAVAERYGVEFAGTGRRAAQPSSETQTVLLRMSSALKYEIQLDALENGSNLTDTILRILAEHFRVRVDIAAPARTTPFGGGRRNRLERTGRR